MNEGYPISCNRFMRILFVVLGITSGRRYVEIGPQAIEVRLGWAFNADLPLANVTDVHASPSVWLNLGAHGGRGRWLVNGARGPLVAIELDPPVRGRTMVFPLKLRQVRVSTDQPERLITAIRTASGS